jgi:hypothetical protein
MIWGLLLVVPLGAVAGPLVHSNVMATIRAAYTADEVKRTVLRHCGAMDAEFSFLRTGPRGTATAPCAPHGRAADGGEVIDHR